MPLNLRWLHNEKADVLVASVFLSRIMLREKETK